MGIDGIERPDWGPGGEVRNAPAEPAPVSHTELIEQIKSEPSGAPQTSTEVATTEQQKSPAHSTSVRDTNGKIVRPDWDKRRDPATGQFLAKPETELRATWQREGDAAMIVSSTACTRAMA